MTKAELLLVEKHIRSIYANWHVCALKKPANGLPKGTLCDDCTSAIAAHITAIQNSTRSTTKK